MKIDVFSHAIKVSDVITERDLHAMMSFCKPLVEFGFDQTLDGKKREEPARPKCLTGDEEARIIATRLGKPPEGYANWSLRLLARKVVELGIATKVSHETVRKTLKKTA